MTYESRNAESSRASCRRASRVLAVVLVLAATIVWASQDVSAQRATTVSQEEAYPAAGPTRDAGAGAPIDTGYPPAAPTSVPDGPAGRVVPGYPGPGEDPSARDVDTGRDSAYPAPVDAPGADGRPTATHRAVSSGDVSSGNPRGGASAQAEGQAAETTAAPYPGIGDLQAADETAATPYPGIADLRAAAARARAAASETIQWPHLTLTIWTAAGALLLLWVMQRERVRSRAVGAAMDVRAVTSTGTANPPPPGIAYLQPLDLPGEPRYFALPEPGVTIGTADDGTCDVVVGPETPGFDTVSPIHASIEVDGRTCVLIDHQSDRGVFVNGQRVGECLLAHDCRVSVGAVRYSFVANERKGDE